MAKKKQAKIPDDLLPINMVNRLERIIRRAVDQTPGMLELEEKEYCNVVLDTLDLLKTGLEMRLEQLNSLEDDEEDFD